MTQLSRLQIDEKWSIDYDPQNNDRPVFIIRHGEIWDTWSGGNAMLAMFYALLARPQWTDVDPDNPPATHMVAVYSDGCSSETLTKFDNEDDFFLSEDAHPLSKDDVRRQFSKWVAAPEGFVPHFMEVTEEDWR